jgi:hypothetical protein
MLHHKVMDIRYLHNVPRATRRKLKSDNQGGALIDHRADPNGRDMIAAA